MFGEGEGVGLAEEDCAGEINGPGPAAADGAVGVM